MLYRCHHWVFTCLFVLVFLLSPIFLAAQEIELERNTEEEAEVESRILARVDPIIVTAKRIPSQKERTAENVIVYTEEDIEQWPAQDVGELLRYIPGVDIETRTKFGQSSGVTISGSRSRHVLVMIDGIPFNTQLSGQANPTKLPVEHIKQIEIIKGASSSAWGSSLGGVINIITKDVGTTDIPKGSFKTSFAEFATTKNSLDLSGKLSGLGYYISGSFLNTDGIREVSDVEEQKYFGKLSYELGDSGTLYSSFGYTGADVRDSRNGKIYLTPHYTNYGALGVKTEKEKWNFDLKFKYNNQLLVSERYLASTGALEASTTNINVYHGISWVGSYRFREADQLVFGSDFDWTKIKSNSFIDEPKSIFAYAPYVNYSLILGQWEFIPGFRFDDNNRFGKQFSPSIGAIFYFEDERNTMARWKISESFNAPPLLNIFNEDPAFLVLPNLDLEAEKAVVYEFGLESQLTQKWHAEMNYYYADIRDALKVVLTDSGFQQQNLEEFARQSGELILNYQVFDRWKLYASGAYNHEVNRSTNQIVRGNRSPRQSFRLGSQFKSKKGFGLNVYGSYDRWDVAASLEPNDRKFIFDVKMTQDMKTKFNDIDMQIFLNIYNITNSKYWVDKDFPLPKRYFEGGFSVNF